jgi:hypothetical protein
MIFSMETDHKHTTDSEISSYSCGGGVNFDLMPAKFNVDKICIYITTYSNNNNTFF